MEASGNDQYLTVGRERGLCFTNTGRHKLLAYDVGERNMRIGGTDGGAEMVGTFHVEGGGEGGIYLEQGIPESIEIFDAQPLTQGRYVFAVA